MVLFLQRGGKEVLLVLHLLPEDLLGQFDLIGRLQVLVEQVLVVLLRVPVHVALLPDEVGVTVGLLQLVGDPDPESGAGQQTHGEEDGFLFVHDVSVVHQVLLHGRDGFDAGRGLWRKQPDVVDQASSCRPLHTV